MSSSLQVGQVLDGKVVKIKPFGAIVSLGDKTQGLVHISQISEGFIQDINDVIAVGDLVKTKVLTIDEEGRKITLSMKAAGCEVSPVQSQKPTAFVEKESRKPSEMSFDEKLKDWIKQSNERQAGINKRNNRR